MFEVNEEKYAFHSSTLHWLGQKEPEALDYLFAHVLSAFTNVPCSQTGTAESVIWWKHYWGNFCCTECTSWEHAGRTTVVSIKCSLVWSTLLCGCHEDIIWTAGSPSVFLWEQYIGYITLPNSPVKTEEGTKSSENKEVGALWLNKYNPV